MKNKPNILFCIFMDLIGYASYLIPVVGEWSDIIWAPISAYIFYISFGGRIGKIGAFLNLSEELLPFIDFIPSFTLAYIYEYFANKKETNKSKYQ